MMGKTNNNKKMDDGARRSLGQGIKLAHLATANRKKRMEDEVLVKERRGRVRQKGCDARWG